MNNYDLIIPCGYSVEEHVETVYISDAGQILAGKRQRKYTSATRHEWQAELVRHFWVCPHCNAHIPAYPEFLGKRSSFEKIERPVVADWATLQMSLFEEPDKALHFNNPIQNGKISCPQCKRESERNSKSKKLAFCKGKHRLEITLEVNELKDIFSLKWMSNSWLNISFPIYETVVFNFRNGHTFLKLHNGHGINYTISDITQKPYSWSNGPLYAVLDTNKVASRMLKRYFVNISRGALPFTGTELTLDKYVLMCRFLGYSRCFYNAIPFVNDSRCIDGSFKHVAKMLHDAKNIPAIYKKSSLPSAKTVRRIFFENPGLFFYIKECEQFWKVLNDVNLFRELISCESIYEILSQFHLFPGMISFFSDYSKFKGARSLIKKLEDNQYETNLEAVMYGNLNESAKKKERANWKKGRSSFEEDDEDDDEYYPPRLSQPVKYSTPFAQTDPSITPCCIDGLSFTWLSTSADYYETGNALHNCLRSWSRSDNPVIVVKDHNTTLAAIEINTVRRIIVQARAANNRLIETGSKLENAYEKWKKKYSLKERPYGYFDDDELPI